MMDRARREDVHRGGEALEDILRRVLREVRPSPPGPEDLPHERRFSFTSSWGVTSPASDSRRPPSTLAMKHSRSIASSSVASSGRVWRASRARLLGVGYAMPRW